MKKQANQTSDETRSMASELSQIEKRLKLDSLDRALRFPKYFEVETTNICNARCAMCSINDWNTRSGLMTDALFQKIADEMKGHAEWIEKVALFRDGEPLADKKLETRIQMLKDREIRVVSMSTNGSLMTEARARSLLEAGIDEIMFSIDGHTKETFEQIRTGLKYEEVRDNCLRFIALRDEIKTNTRICIRMILQDINEHEFDQWTSFWSSKVGERDSVYAKQLHTWGNQIQSKDCQDNDNSSYIWPCISPFSTMVIHMDGRVPLCGVDYNAKMLMGDVNQESIAQIWNSQRFNDVRKKHRLGLRNNISFCVGCRIWDLNEIVRDNSEM